MVDITPEALRNLRERKRMTLDKLAEKAGVDRQTIHRIESGRRHVHKTTLKRLAEALNVEEEALTRPLGPDDQDHDSAWDPDKSQLNLRISKQARNALLLVSKRYDVKPAQIVELAALLFNWAAERCLRQREAQLDDLQRRYEQVVDELSGIADEVYGGPPPPIASGFDEILADEQMAIQDRYLFDDPNSDRFRNPIGDLLTGLASELGDQVEFGGWDRDTPPNYSVCKDEAVRLANGDEGALQSILQGYAPLHELPKEDWEELRRRDSIEFRWGSESEVDRTQRIQRQAEERERRAKERVEWLRSHLPRESSEGSS